MDDYRNFISIQIGGLAKDTLQPGIQGSVMGVTSSGVFLNSSDKILFLTEAPYNSPYNIQIESISPLSTKIAVGDAWRFEAGNILFETDHIQIDIQAARVWQPSLLRKTDNSHKDQVRRMNALLDRLSDIDPHKGWLFLKGAEITPTHLNGEEQRIHDLTNRFLTNARLEDLSACLESARPILGLGGGLTPSGDDWLAGFFLFFARANRQDRFILDLGADISRLARERTTTISANRIEAACRGWAEEMFLEVLDHLLVSEAALSDEQVRRMINFGHSSGVDTCMGIRAALRLFKKPLMA